MSRNIEIVEKFYELFKVQDRSYLDLCSEDIEWVVMNNMPNGGTFVGKDEIFGGYFPRMLSVFGEFHAVVEEFLDAGQNVIVIGRYQGVGKSTGNFFDSPFAHVYTLKDSKITRFRQYTDTYEIRNAVGK